MVWHDCKTDPPKENGDYLLIYKRDGKINFLNLLLHGIKFFIFVQTMNGKFIWEMDMSL